MSWCIRTTNKKRREENDLSQGCQARDLTSQRWSQVLWVASLAAFIAGWPLHSLRAVLWSSGLTLAGGLCIANAARCRRSHCYITGPLFLIGALLSGLRGSGLLNWSWNTIGTFILVGLAIACLTECLAGKYVGHERAR